MSISTTTIQLTTGRTVPLTFEDRGLIGNRFVTRFILEGRQIMSYCPQAVAEGKNGAREREALDTKALAEYGGVFSTIDWGKLR
jgi:hypothetical protein